MAWEAWSDENDQIILINANDTAKGVINSCECSEALSK
jgi:hypothetical protein